MGFENEGLIKMLKLHSLYFSKIMFLFFKNTVKIHNLGKHFTIFVNLNKLSLSKQLHLC